MSQIDDFGRDYYTVYDEATGAIAHAGYLTGERPWKELETGQDITFKRSKTEADIVIIDGVDKDNKRKTIIVNKVEYERAELERIEYERVEAEKIEEEPIIEEEPENG